MEVSKRLRQQYREASKRYHWRHREERIAYNRQYRKDNLEKERERCRRYKAEHKEESHATSKIWRAKNKEATKMTHRRWQTKLKIETLTHYGNGKCGCVKCGESRLACLSLDHIKGDGGEKRRINNLGGLRLYLDLRKRGFPDEGYQTLCMNCQFVKCVEEKEHERPHRS